MSSPATSFGATRSADALDTGYRRIWDLAWPVAVTTSNVTLFMVANLFWVGHLGTNAIAAVAITSHVLFIAFGVSQCAFAGTMAIVSRRVGAGDLGAACAATLHALVLAAALGTAIGLAGHLFAADLLAFFAVDQAVEAIALPYLRLVFLGEAFLFVSMALSAAYSASGDTRTPMLLNFVLVALNAALDPLFMFAPGELVIAGIDVGYLGMGVTGAAAADVVVGAIGVVAFFAISLALGRPFGRARWPRRLQLETFRSILAIGIPASTSFLARPLSTLLLMRIIASFGTEALAAFGIALRTFSINWIPYSGLNTAVSSLVGQSLGKRDVGEAENTAARGLRIGALLAVGFCLFYELGAERLVAFFDADPEVVSTGALFIRVIGFGFLLSGPQLALTATMNGAGDTKPAMFATIVANWAYKLPCCWLLALPLGLGIKGVWLGMVTSVAVEAAIVAWWFRRGGWKHRAV